MDVTATAASTTPTTTNFGGASLQLRNYQRHACTWTPTAIGALHTEPEHPPSFTDRPHRRAGRPPRRQRLGRRLDFSGDGSDVYASTGRPRLESWARLVRRRLRPRAGRGHGPAGGDGDIAGALLRRRVRTTCWASSRTSPRRSARRPAMVVVAHRRGSRGSHDRAPLRWTTSAISRSRTSPPGRLRRPAHPRLG